MIIIFVVILLVLPDLCLTLTPFCYPGDSCFPSISIIHTFASSLPNGSVVFPSDNKTYTDVTLMHNLIRTSYPFAVVMAMSRDDVKDTIAFARQYNLRITVLGTGHDFNGRSTGNGTLQINLSLMKSREVDLDSWRHENGTITVGPGNQWIDVYREVDKYGRVIVGGSAHTVGMGGYTLGGGHSPICRFYGMAIDNLLEVEMIMADGRIVTATKDYVHTINNNGSTSNVSDSEFFWAIAGGGGGTFGVSTRLVFKLHMPPEKVVKLIIIYPMYTVFGEDVFQQVTDKIKELFTDDLPKEWGGYLIFDGNTDEYSSKGHVTFVLNHLGSNTTASYKYLASLIGFLPTKRYFSVTEYQTFLEYEETIQDQLYYFAFVYNSLIPSSNLTGDFRDYIRQTVFTEPTPNSGTVYTATLIGGKMREVGPEVTSVHPGFRSALLSMSGGVGFGLPGIPEIEKIFYKTMERNIEFAEFGNGMYPNEAAQATPNWQTNFWGTNYHRLYRIKLREDPDGFFTCDQCVGSELRNQLELKTSTSPSSSLTSDVTSSVFSTASSSSSTSQSSSLSDDSSSPLSSTTMTDFQTTPFPSTLKNPISHASTTSQLSILNFFCYFFVLCAYQH